MKKIDLDTLKNVERIKKLKSCYITTPIYYASGKVHIGNSYTTIACDCFARFHRNLGIDTYYLTGMDEHGLKIETAAKNAGITPQEFVDKIAIDTKELWENLKISNDGFIRTSDEKHVKLVQECFEIMLKKGDIYLGTYEGNYCMPCEAYFTKTQLGENGTCPDCGRPTQIMKDESYFLNLKKYEKRLLEFIKENPDFITPESRKNEVVSFIEHGLEDLCVSRTSFKWGIPVLSNPKHVVYVWIDALLNYLSAIDYKQANDELYKKYWLNCDKVVHVVGKDILRFHAIYWPIMLMSLDLPINFKLQVHGWIQMKDGKMSKSKGNMVYPMDVVNNYGLDALRYYLVKEMPIGNDGLFTWERFIDRYNTDLANDLGNLTSRTISMINKYYGGVVKKVESINDVDYEIEDLALEVINGAIIDYADFSFQAALTKIWSLISRANKYIDETMPWVLAKEKDNDEVINHKLQSVMYHLYEVLRVTSVLINPVLIDASKIMFEELGLNNNKELTDLRNLKYLEDIDIKVIEKPVVLFKRLDPAIELKKFSGE